MNTAPIKTEEVYPFNLRKGDTIMIAPACYDDMEAMPYTITKIKVINTSIIYKIFLVSLCVCFRLSIFVCGKNA